MNKRGRPKTTGTNPGIFIRMPQELYAWCREVGSQELRDILQKAMESCKDSELFPSVVWQCNYCKYTAGGR